MYHDPFVSTLKEWLDVSMQSSMRHLIRYARESGFSISHLGALFHIHNIGSCGVTDLGDHLGISSAAASQMLDRLVQQGLFLRKEDPNDRRVKQIVLTEKGHQILEEGIRARQGWLADLAQTLSESEKEMVITALNIMVEKINLLNQPVDSAS